MRKITKENFTCKGNCGGIKQKQKQIAPTHTHTKYNKIILKIVNESGETGNQIDVRPTL